MLGFQGSLQDTGWSWDPDSLKPGQELAQPKPLFAKLDEAIIEKEMQRISG